MIRILTLTLVMISSLWAGQSLTSGPVTSTSFPARSKDLPYRVEFYIHDWPVSPCQNCRPFTSGGIGFDSYFTAGTHIVFHSPSDASNTFVIPLATFPSKRMYVRFQRDPAVRTLYLEMWDENGKRLISNALTYAPQSGTNSTGAEATGQGAPLAFVRVHSDLVPLNSRPPVHRDDGNRLLEWKFDGNRNDSSGNLYNGSGTASYAATPDQRAYSVIKVNGTTWSNWTSLRAGFPQSLIGTDSYSQADNSAAVTYKWHLKSGPSKAMIDDDTLATPTVTGLVFGNYVFGLKVSSPTGDKDYSELDVGAVATDGKGVVIQGNPDADRLFGPMIAFGKNPWQYADDTHLRGAKLRSQYYDTISPPEWKQYLPGKIDYTVTAHLPQTTTVGAIPPTGMTVPVSSTANLNLSSFPTIIAVGGIPGYGGEEVLICSASGSILTVCFDGRGWRNSNPRSWGTGTSVFQRRVVGTGTNFLTTFCPAGPGQEGPVQYSAGSITVSPASAVLTGAGTEWTSANGIYTYLTARIEGTHSGIPFVFFSPVSAINSPTQITLGRPWPSDADAGSVSYKLIQGGYNQFAPLWTRPDGSEGQTIQAVSACLNDTDLYLAAGAEAITGVNIQKNYALLRNYWISFGGNGTPNYYDEVLANYALYFRSGWKPALDAARKLGDYWLSQPLLDDGWYPGAPRNSSIAGVVAGTVLDGRTQNWPGLRRMASKGVTAIAESCAGDLREHSYGVMWLAFAAQFDPVDTGSSTTVNQRSYWKAKLAESYARDDGCRGADNSFPTPLIVSTTSVTVTNGSTAVTGTGFTAASCLDRTAGGTGTISVNGSTLTVESGVPGGAKILITGTQSGVAFNQYFQFSGTTLVLLSGRWPGDSGSVTWQSEASGEANSWIAGSTSSAPTPGKIYGCSYNSPTSLTLNRNWAEASGVGIFTTGAYALTGWGTQPFMLGIATLANKMAAQGASGATATNYAALANATAGWVRNTGFDAATGGLYYGRGFSNCEPVLGTSTTPFIFRNLGCNFGASADGKATARALLAEAQNAVRVVYEANPSASNREWGDTVYANLWGRTGLTDPAVPLAEGKIDNYFASDQSLKGGKWYGFQFGIGMAHQWPAVRLGGQQAAIIEDLVLDYNTNPYPAATAVVVKLQRPSGEIVTYNCGTESCAVQLDRRQGSHWYQLEYLNISGAVLARGEWQFLPLP